METNNRQNDEIEIDLLEIAGLLLSKIWLIILVGMTTAIIGFCISFFLITPTYQSTTKIYILNKTDSQSVTYSDMQLGTQLTKDYKELITSRYVMEDVIQKMSLDKSYDDLKKNVSISSPADTRVVYITVTDTDPRRAMDICNSIRESAAVHISNVMDIDAVNVVETANMPTKKHEPSVSRWTIIAGIIGALFIATIEIIQYLLDDTIKSSDDVERYLGLSTLGMIPIIAGTSNGKSKKKKKKLVGNNTKK